MSLSDESVDLKDVVVFWALSRFSRSLMRAWI